MVAKQYRYAHYFFFFLILYEIVASLGRAIVGYYFSLNFGFSLLLPTYTFYVTYLLSEQFLKITHNISLVFALSYSLIVLGIFMFDVSYLYVKKSDLLYLVKEYGSYDTLFNLATITTFIGFFLFFYGVYLLYREKS